MKNKIIYIISAIIVVLDQIFKMFITKEITIINGIFYFKPVTNSGAAWSILYDKPILLIILTIIILFILLRYQTFFKMNKRNKLAFALIYGGLLGNLLDRVIFGYVRDFIKIIIFNYNYPIFNLADISLVIGVLLLMVAIIKGEDKREKSISK